jgi:WD40 repeat protein/tetratricopeptide (TPR) repeat protein
VWLARSVTGALRAVKIVHRSSFDNERPFRREFEGILKFEPISRRHDSQVDILHVGRGDDYFYYVMELADDQATGGQIQPDNYRPRTLKSDLLFRSRLPFEECVSVGIALTTALEHLHQNGLVHRDIKPSNIIFVNGVAKLADIGLVTGVDTTRSYVGTEGFAAPEGPGTPQADLFGLGKVLYEMSTGKDRQEFPELPTNLRDLPDREGLAELNAVIARACRHDPRDRYPTAAAMRADLELLQSGKSLARLRRVEARLRAAIRIGAVVCALAVFAIAAWLYQAHQTRVVRELSERSLRAEKRNREALADLQVANGTKLAFEPISSAPPGSQPSRALAWFARALANVQDDPILEHAHRLRIAALLARQPKLIHQFVHPGPAYRTAFTPDGNRLVTQSGDEIRVFNLASGQLEYTNLEGRHLASRPHGTRYAPGLGFNADGKRLIVRAFWPDEETHLYNLEDGKLVRPPRLGLGDFVRILDCIDGRTALIQDGTATARLFDLDTGAPLSAIFAVPGKILSGRLTPSRTHLALLYEDPARAGGQRALLQIWRADSEGPMGPPIPAENDTRFLLSADGSRLVVGLELSDPRSPRLLDTASGKTISTFDGAAHAFVIDTDTQWLVMEEPAGKFGRTFFNPDTGESLKLNYKEDIRDVTLSPDGLILATASDNGDARLWNRSTGEELGIGLSHGSWCYGVGFSPDGERLATACQNGTVRVWDLTAVRAPRLLLRDSGSVLDAAVSPDGKKIVTLSEVAGLGLLRMWDSRSGRALAPPIASMRKGGEIRFSPDGRHLLVRAQFDSTVTDDRAVAVISGRENGFANDLPPSLDRGAWVYRVNGTRMSGPLALGTDIPAVSAEFDPASKRVLIVSGSSVNLWDADTGWQLLSVPYTDSVHGAACFLTTPNQIALAKGASIEALDANSGKLIRRFIAAAQDSRFQIQGLTLSPDGQCLAASGNDQRFRIWNVSSGEPALEPLWQGGRPVWTAFSHNGKFIISYGQNPDTTVWKVGESRPCLPALLHEMPVHGAEFSLDDRFISTYGEAGTVRLWDAASGGLIDSFSHIDRSRGPDVASAAHFLPSAGELLTAGWDGRVCVWRLEPCGYSVQQVASLAEVLCARDVDNPNSPVPPQKTGAELESLRRDIPEAFRTTPAQRAYWHEQMARVACASKLWQAVVFHIARCLQLQPSLPESPTGDQLLTLRGDALAQLGRFSEAESDFQRAVQIDPWNLSSWQRWAAAALAQDRTNAYSEICAKAFAQFTDSTNTDSTTLHLEQAVVASYASYPGLPDYSLPLRFIDELLQASKDSPGLEGPTVRAKLEFRVGAPQKAIEDLERADQDDPETFFFLARALHQLGNRDKAVEQFEHGVQVLEKLQKSGDLDWYGRIFKEVERKEAAAVLGIPASPSPVASSLVKTHL